MLRRHLEFVVYDPFHGRAKQQLRKNSPRLLNVLDPGDASSSTSAYEPIDPVDLDTARLIATALKAGR